MTFKGIVTTVSSETLLQFIVGFGFPSAEQFKVNLAGAVMAWLLEVIMFLGGPTKSKIRICTWLKSCCGFCIFTSSTLRVKLMPTTADLSWISCRGAQVESLTSILIMQVGKFITKIMGQSAPYPSFLAAELESTCYSYSTQVFCFWCSITSQGVMLQHQQKKINIILMKNAILTSWED